MVVPSLFALGLFVIKQPQMAGFSVFGTFAHLVMVNYAPSKGDRSAEAATLTLLGAVLVTLGTLASVDTWTAVAGATSAGFLSAWPALLKGHVAVVRTALLLSFMLAVAVPTPFGAVLPQLSGWLLAGVVAQPVLRLFWIPIRPAILTQAALTSRNGPAIPSSWLAHAACIGIAMGLAIFAARVLNLSHAFWVVLGVLPVLSAGGMSPSRTFWHEQAGTLLGFVVGAALVLAVGSHQEWYWIILPCLIFFSAYASTALGFVAGQAGFTVFAVVLFCILSPSQRQIGILRVEDIAIGGVLSLLVASLQRLGESRV